MTDRPDREGDDPIRGKGKGKPHKGLEAIAQQARKARLKADEAIRKARPEIAKALRKERDLFPSTWRINADSIIGLMFFLPLCALMTWGIYKCELAGQESAAAKRQEQASIEEEKNRQAQALTAELHKMIDDPCSTALRLFYLDLPLSRGWWIELPGNGTSPLAKNFITPGALEVARLGGYADTHGISVTDLGRLTGDCPE